MQRRIVLVGLLFVFFILILVGRLVYLQLLSGPELALRAVNNRLYDIDLKGYTRGNILDRNYQRLTGNITEKAVVVLPALLKEPRETAGVLAGILDIPVNQLIARLNDKHYRSFILKSNLEDEEVVRIRQLHFPGIFVLKLRQRYEPLAVHLIGYSSERDGKWASEYAGVEGIEAIYEHDLNRKDVGLAVIIDGNGRVIPGLGLRQIGSELRREVVLTIDRQIQKSLEKVLDRKVETGALVVMDIDSGDVLAMASRPVSHPCNVSDINGSCLRNRALELYESGSLFDILLKGALLEENQVDAGCLSSYARKFGLDRVELLGYPLDLVNELQLDSYDYQKTNEQPAVLEGVKLTLLQAASLISTIANGGAYRTPRVVKGVRDESGEWVREFPLPLPEQVIQPGTAKQLREMLVGLTIGKEAWIEEIGTAGKKATVQTEEKIIEWFAGYAPLDDPQIAVAVLLERNQEENEKAAGIFRELIDEIFSLTEIK